MSRDVYTEYWARYRVDGLLEHNWLGRPPPFIAGGPTNTSIHYEAGDVLIAIGIVDQALQVLGAFNVTEFLSMADYVARNQKKFAPYACEDDGFEGHPELDRAWKANAKFERWREELPELGPFCWPCASSNCCWSKM